MKKKLLAILLSMAMIVMMLPTMVCAETTIVTNVGENITSPMDASTVAGGVILQATAANKKITYKWNAVEGASAYKLYQAQVNKKKFKLIKTTANTTFAKKSLKKGTIYKAYVVACASDGSEIAKSMEAYAITKGGKYSNAKTVSAATTLDVTSGKTASLNAKIKAKDSSKAVIKSVKKLKFICSDKAIATVNDKGVVTGVNGGICYVLTIAANGKYALTRVKVIEPAKVTFAVNLNDKTVEFPKVFTLEYETWGDAALAGANYTLSATQEDLSTLIELAEGAGASLGILSQFTSMIDRVDLTLAVKSDESGNIKIAVDSFKICISGKTKDVSVGDASLRVLYDENNPVVVAGAYDTIENGHKYLLAK